MKSNYVKGTVFLQSDKKVFKPDTVGSYPTLQIY